MRFLLHLGVFAAVLAALQTALYFGGLQRDVASQRPETLAAIDRLTEAQTKVLCFGDSTAFFVAQRDKDLRDLGRMIRDGLRPHSAGMVSHGGCSLTQFEWFCEYLVCRPNPPKVVVIPVNLRSFGPRWDLRAGWQFPRERIFTRWDTPIMRVFYRPLTVFKAPGFNLDPITEPDWLRAPVFDGDRRLGTVGEFQRAADVAQRAATPDLPAQFRGSYMHRIDESHRKVKSLKAIARTLRAAGIRAVFYVTPLDCASGRNYLGEEFAQRIADNVTLLRQVLEREGGHLYDFSALFGTADFVYSPYVPDEHVDDSARLALARNLADIVRSLLNTGR